MTPEQRYKAKLCSWRGGKRMAKKAKAEEPEQIDETARKQTRAAMRSYRNAKNSGVKLKLFNARTEQS